MCDKQIHGNQIKAAKEGRWGKNTFQNSEYDLILTFCSKEHKRMFVDFLKSFSPGMRNYKLKMIAWIANS